MNLPDQPPPWMKYLLLAAGAYNFIWGAAAIFAPSAMLSWLQVDATGSTLAFWQCIGMLVGVYGLAYLIAATDAYRHWPLVLVGFIGKVLGPIGFLFAYGAGTLPLTFGWMNLTNDLIWWAPFAMILWGAVRHQHLIGNAYEMPEADDPIRELRTNDGRRLDDLANEHPQLVVFLRHAGCTFCREAAHDLGKQRSEIEAAGCGIILVHVGKEDDPESFSKYGLDDLPRISDPTCRLYRQFGLDIGTFSQLFGARVWARGIAAGIFGGHGLGLPRANSFQMPGVYLYHCGQILDGFQHERASDRPVYLDFVRRNLAPVDAALAK
ncbi:redoxin domain-containing protein [Blastopirellula sp. JC732]|uniref:Redoxin domain-containing protein n=1 Tax=Blastopirellula sediminis TaxID=2894196 RepID=A0A9X1SF79_9BACT|nr:redoxin domain-containing protein [Blastopirellula sediminis]MCC9608368.1 redoxin domain-containing protein [Blastopirellula sediminis]MCC9628855.1 redoxin domain-containing protein [Blastopirellula sediminis]